MSKIIDSYQYDIQRYDVYRYVILYIFGGLYLDIDVKCIKHIKENITLLFTNDERIDMDYNYDFFIENCAMYSRAQTPWLANVLRYLQFYNKQWHNKEATTIRSVGSVYLTNIFLTKTVDKTSIKLHDHKKYFEHDRDKTWIK